jgi:D-glycero-beta-D-manno-heptose-7-phosphate kinase
MANKVNVQDLFKSFEDMKVLIIGDIMIDSYMWGRVERISPEAPVPVVSVTKTELRLGGAANVALNVKALGATPYICSIIGTDSHGDNMIRLFEEEGLSSEGILRSETRSTTVKTRIISKSQQILRVDEEITSFLNRNEEKDLLNKITSMVTTINPDVIVFQDYNKGVLTLRVIREAINVADHKNIPTCVDPKKNNFLAFENCTLFKPNLKELKEGLKVDIGYPDKMIMLKSIFQLQENMPHEITMVTLSEHGIFINHEDFTYMEDAHHRNIADVSGAGDTVISLAALTLAAKQPLEVVASLSNIAGGLVCESIGVVPVSKERLMNEASKHL